MKILFIAHYFQPEPNFFVGLPFAKALRDRGHQVQVLTGLPNYPGGKIYDGYKVKLIQREVMDGIEIENINHFGYIASAPANVNAYSLFFHSMKF